MSLEIRTFDGSKARKKDITKRIGKGKPEQVDFAWEIESGIEQWYGHAIFHCLARAKSLIPSHSLFSNGKDTLASRRQMNETIRRLRRKAFTCIKLGSNLEPARLNIQQWLLRDYFKDILKDNENPYRDDICDILIKLADVRKRKASREVVHQDEWSDIERLILVANQRLLNHKTSNQINETKTILIANNERAKRRKRRFAENLRIARIRADRDVLFGALRMATVLQARNTPPATANALREALNARDCLVYDAPEGVIPHFNYYCDVLKQLISFIPHTK